MFSIFIRQHNASLYYFFDHCELSSPDMVSDVKKLTFFFFAYLTFIFYASTWCHMPVKIDYYSTEKLMLQLDIQKFNITK